MKKSNRLVTAELKEIERMPHFDHFILLGKVRTLVEWADDLLSKMWEWVTDGWVDIP